MAGCPLALWSSTRSKPSPPAGPSNPPVPPPPVQWAPTPAHQGTPHSLAQGVAATLAPAARTGVASRDPPGASVSTALGVCARLLVHAEPNVHVLIGEDPLHEPSCDRALRVLRWGHIALPELSGHLRRLLERVREQLRECSENVCAAHLCVELHPQAAPRDRCRACGRPQPLGRRAFGLTVVASKVNRGGPLVTWAFT
jgi:hypothetical protein